MAEKFVKAVAKPSVPGMNPIRYPVYEMLAFFKFMIHYLKNNKNYHHKVVKYFVDGG